MSAWIGFAGSVCGGLLTLIGVRLTLKRNKENIEQQIKISYMPILEFSIKKEMDDVDLAVSCVNGELITSGFYYAEKEHEEICIDILDNNVAFDFSIDGVLVNGIEMKKTVAFCPSNYRITQADSFNMNFDIEKCDTNYFCLIRFSYSDRFGNRYYQDLPITYSERNFQGCDGISKGQVVKLRDIKQPIEIIEKNKYELKNIAKEYIDYEVFCK